MLLCRSRVIALLEPREDSVLLEKHLPTSSLNVHVVRLSDFRIRRDCIEIEVLSEYNDAGAVLENVVGGTKAAFVSGGGLFGGGVGGAGDCGADVAEEFEHVLETGWIELGVAMGS